MASLLRTLSALPFRALRVALRLVDRASRGPTPAYLLPVAGLEQERAHSILFGLREAAHEADDDEAAIVGQWLAALQLTQAGMDRLVATLHAIEGDLTFWRRRLEGNSRHGLFLLLQQGPTKFVGDMVHLVKRQEQRLHRRRHAQRQLTATEKIEMRVTILRSLQGRVAESLAQVNASAGKLYLRPARSSSGSSSQNLAAEPRRMLEAAQEAVRLCLKSTAQAFERLVPVQQQLLTRPESLMAPTAAAPRIPGSDTASSQQGGSSGGSSAAAAGGGNGGGNEETEAAEDVAAALARARRCVGVAELAVSSNMTVTDAIALANKQASRSGPVLEIPQLVKAPSHWKQYWIRYLAAGAVAGYATLLVYRHSRLSGSRDMERWAQQAASGLRSTYRENVLGPLKQLRDELFKTYRQRRSIVSEAEYGNDRESLRRMLADFEADYRAKHGGQPPLAPPPDTAGANGTADAAAGSSATSAASDEILPGMAFMMDAYEAELKRPIRNVINGQLPRTLLIQVQKLKLDTESAMLEMDQLLKANELNLALIAAIPAFLAAGGAVFLVVRWLRPSPPDPKYEALPCRMAMVALERALDAADTQGTLAAQGLMIFGVSKVYQEAWRLYQRHDGSSTASEWPNLRTDLTNLAGPQPLKQKLRISKRMTRIYTIFKF